MDIDDSMFSLLVDESTDISVKKQLGICILFFSETRQSVVSTFLNILEIDNGTAASVVDGIKKTLLIYNLDIQKMRGIGSDNASVMTGKNNGVHAILKK